MAGYGRRLERKGADEEDEPVVPAEARETKDELPPSADLVAEIEQFLRQQRPETP